VRIHNAGLGTIAHLCQAISLQLRHLSTIEKKLVKQQYLHTALQYCTLRPTNGWHLFVSLGHPSEFQQVLHLRSVTARHCSNGYQPNFAAFNRGHHLYSAGRPSRWALAHSLVDYNFPKPEFMWIIKQNWNQFLLVVKANALKQQISNFYPQIQRTAPSDHIYVSQWPVVNVNGSFCA